MNEIRKLILTVELPDEWNQADAAERVLLLAAEKVGGRLTRAIIEDDPRGGWRYVPSKRKTLHKGRFA